MLEIRTVVCAVDFSEISEHALAYAVRLAEKFSAQLQVVHVCHPPTLLINDTDVILPPDFHEDYRAAMQQRMDALIGTYRDSGLPIQGQLREGAPQDEIVAFARERGADLVVLGTHGHRGLTHLLLGSVAERVVRNAHIPVLTVPKPPVQ